MRPDDEFRSNELRHTEQRPQRGDGDGVHIEIDAALKVQNRGAQHIRPHHRTGEPGVKQGQPLPQAKQRLRAGEAGQRVGMLQAHAWGLLQGAQHRAVLEFIGMVQHHRIHPALLGGGEHGERIGPGQTLADPAEMHAGGNVHAGLGRQSSGHKRAR